MTPNEKIIDAKIREICSRWDSVGMSAGGFEIDDRRIEMIVSLFSDELSRVRRENREKIAERFIDHGHSVIQKTCFRCLYNAGIHDALDSLQKGTSDE